MRHWFVDSLHNSEWLTVYILGFQALLFAVQAVIFIWQGRILGHHGEVMESQKEISKKQADTAELIGKALDQQGTILAAQFEFQKQLNVSSARNAMFDLVDDLIGTVESLLIKMQHTGFQQSSILAPQGFVDIRMKSEICKRALDTCKSISPGERELISKYLDDVNAMQRTGDTQRDISQLTQLDGKYKDLMKQLRTGTRD